MICPCGLLPAAGNRTLLAQNGIHHKSRYFCVEHNCIRIASAGKECITSRYFSVTANHNHICSKNNTSTEKECITTRGTFALNFRTSFTPKEQ